MEWEKDLKAFLKLALNQDNISASASSCVKRKIILPSVQSC